MFFPGRRSDIIDLISRVALSLGWLTLMASSAYSSDLCRVERTVNPASRSFLGQETKTWNISVRIRAMAASLAVHINGALGLWTLLAVGSGFPIFAGGKCYFCPHSC